MKKHLFFYDDELSGAAPPADPVVAAEKVADHVEEAEASAVEAGAASGDEGWKAIAEELRGLRGDIKEMMGKFPVPADDIHPEHEEAIPEVVVPKPEPRKKRRFNRKVTGK